MRPHHLARIQHNFKNLRRPLAHHHCLEPRPQTRAPSPRYGLVSTHGPFSVTAMQCSKCAEFDPSLVTAVHLSFRTTASGRPAFTIGSTASTIPVFNRGFSFLRST